METSHKKESMNFSQLGLAPAQVRSCESLGYTEPTPIQEQGIPVVLSGQDLIGCAETGTGKTAAFLLPLIQKMTETTRPGVRVLVLAPTRELAMQIQKNYGELNRVKANRGVTVIGGANMRTQISDLRRGAAIVIATPGRLLDLTERGAINLSTVEVLVLDEADRMLDMGFLPAIRRILALVPARRQAALRGFRDGRTRVLVATDIAARGLDVDAVSHVINFDVPSAPEDYVHRIGRTGRAGNTGRAITIVTPVDESSMRAIERLTGQPVARVTLPGFGGRKTEAASKPFARATAPRAVFTRSFRPRRASR